MPVLLYHRVADTQECGDNIASQKFEGHIIALKKYNIEIVSLSDYLKNPSFKKKSIAITFDDGMRNIHKNAYPLSLRYGFNFTVFLNTNFIGKTNWHNKKTRTFYERKELASPSERDQLWYFEYLTKDEILEMKAHGIIFGSHSRTHPVLTGLSHCELEEEILKSKKELEDILREEVIYFSYPWGTFSRSVKNVVRKSGYRFAFTSDMSRSSSNLSVGRLLVKSGWDGERLVKEIRETCYFLRRF